MPEHAHGRLCIHGPTVGALCLGPRHIGITIAFDLWWLGVAALIQTDSPSQVSQLGQLHSGAVAPSAQSWGAGAGGARVQSWGG